MIFNEELFSEDRFLLLNKDRQSRLIGKYCAEVEERIRTAASRIEAKIISENVCQNFKKECSSQIVRNALFGHVEELINKYWQNENNHA